MHAHLSAAVDYLQFMTEEIAIDEARRVAASARDRFGGKGGKGGKS